MRLTPLGEFVHKHSVLVPPKLWKEIFYLAEGYLDDGSDWEFFLSELISGCQELRDGELQKIICVAMERE